MSPTLAVFFSLFTLLLISTGVFAISKKTPIPYTVLLVLTGILLIPLSHLSFFSFIGSFQLTPNMLFFVFLPTLIFESAYNIKANKIAENMRAISLLSIVGLLVSTLTIATALYYIFIFIQLPIPFIVTLLFGVIISATDPVAVLALFKEYGTPKRLSLIFEGESLFNDGTAFALFLIILQIIAVGWTDTSLVEGLTIFASMVFGGVMFGVLMGVLFSKLIERVKDNEHIEITLTMIVAHMTFLLAELISHTPIFGHTIHLSSIIATVIAAMVIGNYGRSKISPRVLDYMEELWSYFAFVANSLVFILIGLLFADLDIDFSYFILPIGIAIVVTIIARALSIYTLIPLFNLTKKEAPIPPAWQHLMAWGSLRGALAVTMVLLIPDDLTLAAWTYDFSIKDFITAITIGSIYFTLFVKATTIGPLINKLKLNQLHEIEQVEYEESKAFIYARVLLKLTTFRSKGYIDSVIYEKLNKKYKKLYAQSCDKCNRLIESGNNLQGRMLDIYAIGVEKNALKNLYLYEEISETIYKTINHELDDQSKNTEDGRLFNAHEIERTFKRIAKKTLRPSKQTRDSKCAEVLESYTYYRARSVIARKAVKELTHLSHSYLNIINNQKMIDKTISFYKDISEYSRNKMNELRDEYPEEVMVINERFAERGVFQAEEKVLDDIFKKEMISPKIHIMLRDEMKKNTL